MRRSARAMPNGPGLGDPVIEINLTPNRQDCTGVHGIARDLSAADMGKFKDPGIKPIKGEFPCPVKVTVEDATLCPGFALRLVRGVKNGPSPEWLQKRLTSIGLRPINALVDITNFMTYDRARPLHVFDAEEGERQSHRAPRQGRREPAGARRPHLHARSRDLRDRGRARRRIARRHHGRRGVRLRREHHRRADRIGAVERDQHRADRPQARHQFGCALSLRARRRSGLHGAGARARDQTGDGALRRHAVGKRRRRQCLRRRPHHRFPAERGQTAGGNRSAAGRDAAHSRPSRLHGRRQRPGGEGRGAVLAHRRARQGRHRRGDRAHRRRRQGADDAVRARRRRRASRS